MTQLMCGHCEAIFGGTKFQLLHAKYRKNYTPYCSPICRKSALGNKGRLRGKPEVNQGPCPTCGNNFFSKKPKTYCTIECYFKSDKRTSRGGRKIGYRVTVSRVEAALAQRTGTVRKCVECDVAFYKPPNRAKPWCSKPCYRSYMAKRFDRWIANPERMALPQCYDEFLDQQELACIIEGCTWRGHGLSTHVNAIHGVPADEFKRAAGFNLSSGIISKPLAQALRARENVGIALDPQVPLRGTRGILRYHSKEAREHNKKSRALIGEQIGPMRTCIGCGAVFAQSTPYGRALYCTIDCRSTYYKQRRPTGTGQRHNPCNGRFMGKDET